MEGNNDTKYDDMKYEDATSNIQKKKKKKESNNEDVDELAQALFVYWKSREIMKEGECDYEEANDRAETIWKEETNEHLIETFKKAAAVQVVMLGGEYYGTKRRRQVKSDYGKNRASSNPFLLYCKDHKENVREKGGRGKGMTTHSTMWKGLPEEEKLKYVEMAKTNKTKEIGDGVDGLDQPQMNDQQEVHNELNKDVNLGGINQQ